YLLPPEPPSYSSKTASSEEMPDYYPPSIAQTSMDEMDSEEGSVSYLYMYHNVTPNLVKKII
ncbi:hypothetical protein HMI55_002696, partial [Coelomomyces lativittatus]